MKIVETTTPKVYLNSIEYNQFLKTADPEIIQELKSEGLADTPQQTYDNYQFAKYWKENIE